MYLINIIREWERELEMWSVRPDTLLKYDQSEGHASWTVMINWFFSNIPGRWLLAAKARINVVGIYGFSDGFLYDSTFVYVEHFWSIAVAAKGRINAVGIYGFWDDFCLPGKFSRPAVVVAVIISLCWYTLPRLCLWLGCCCCYYTVALLVCSSVL